METRNIALFLLLTFFLSPLLITSISAQEDEDIEVFGLELEKLVTLVNAWLSLFLFVLAFIAYKRDGRKRLFYVSLAFFLFAVKSFLISSELFIAEISWVDPVATALEFAILLSFFFGVLKR